MSKSVVNNRDHFAIIPEWVLYAPISSNAVRLYAAMRRFADDKSMTCYPSRKTIAERCQFSPATVDRSMDELVAIGAIIVTHRKSPKGDWTSNHYEIIAIDPKRYTARDDTHPTDDETGLFTGDELTKANKNESQRTTSKASAFAEAGKALCQAWWEAQNPKPLGNWNGLNIVVRKALQAGYTEDAVRAALDRIGAVPSAQQLQRELNNPRQPQSRRQANEQKLTDMYADARAKAFAAAKGELQ